MSDYPISLHNVHVLPAFQPIFSSMLKFMLANWEWAYQAVIAIEYNTVLYMHMHT